MHGHSRRAPTPPPPPVGRTLVAVALIAGFFWQGGCGPRRPAFDWTSVREITPAFLDSMSAADPTIAVDSGGRVALTWVTRDVDGGMDLWLAVSTDSGTTFTSPQQVNNRPGSVVSHPECRAATAFGPSGALAVAWTESRFDKKNATDVVVRASGDGGLTLGPPAWVNDDHAGRDAAYHAFPALAFRPDGALFATWLDERDYAPRDSESLGAGLYYATSFDGGQTWSRNDILRDLASPYCHPSAVASAEGAVAIAYRSADSDVRDPGLAISLDGGIAFDSDTLVSMDHWQLQACPIDGPALTWNRANGGYYAWYTGAGEPGVYLVPWRPENGAAGVKRALSDSLDRAARPKLAALDAATLIGVDARPAADTTRTIFAVRTLDSHGNLTPWLFLGAQARDGWIAAADARRAYACWIEENERGGRVRVVRMVARGM